MWQLFVGDVLMYKNTQLVANKGFFYDLPLLSKSIIVRCMQLLSSPTTFLIRVFWLQELVVINTVYYIFFTVVTYFRNVLMCISVVPYILDTQERTYAILG